MQELLAMLSQIGNLKTVARAGWVRMQVPQPESVADHSFRTAVLALALAPELGVNTEKLVKMLLVHDLAESDQAVGDITPYDGIPVEEKHRREQEAMQRLCSALPGGTAMLELWHEYVEGRSAEARLAKELDVLEMALQAREYAAQHGKDLGEFLDHAAARVGHPLLAQVLHELRR
jgi:5'-deoxynucleotidase YfbR-like HD superfamily hydrolase